MTPQVSLVSNGRNGEPYLDRAIRDADLEFILVDKGSNDGTLAGLRKRGERESRVPVLEPVRMGAAAAYNWGVPQAAGEYVARQDFDDGSHPGRPRLQAAMRDAQPGVGKVGGYYLLVDERQGVRYVRMPPANPLPIRAAMAKYVPFAALATFRRLAWTQASDYPLEQSVLRDHGRRVRDTLRVPPPDRLGPMPARGSA